MRKSPGTGIVTTELTVIGTIRKKEAHQQYDAELDRLRNPRVLDLCTTPRDKIGVYFLSL